MDLQLNFTDEQIKRVFSHHGFKVIEKDVPFQKHIHGSDYEETLIPGYYVENPMTNELIPMEEAFNSLMNRYVQSILFGFSKADIIQSLITN
jgi:hypothetical protein